MTVDDLPSLQGLAEHAAEKLVDAMTTEAWSAVKDKFKAVLGLEHRMDADRDKISKAGADVDRERMRLAWQTRIEDVLEGQPQRVAELREALRELGPMNSRVAVTQRIGRVDTGGKAVQISGDHNVVADKVHHDNRSYRFGLGWVLPIVRNHWIVSTIVAVVIIGGGTTAVVAHDGDESAVGAVGGGRATLAACIVGTWSENSTVYLYTDKTGSKTTTTEAGFLEQYTSAGQSISYLPRDGATWVTNGDTTVLTGNMKLTSTYSLNGQTATHGASHATGTLTTWVSTNPPSTEAPSGVVVPVPFRETLTCSDDKITAKAEYLAPDADGGNQTWTSTYSRIRPNTSAKNSSKQPVTLAILALSQSCAAAMKTSGITNTRTAVTRYCESKEADDGTKQTPAMISIGQQAEVLCNQIKPPSPPSPEMLPKPSWAGVANFTDDTGSVSYMSCLWGSDVPGGTVISFGITHDSTSLADAPKIGVAQSDGSYVSSGVDADPEALYYYAKDYPDHWSISANSDADTPDSQGNNLDNAWRSVLPAAVQAINTLMRTTGG